MDTMLCPYCECRVMIRDVDDEGGMCPECGAVITGAAMMNLSDTFDDELDDQEVADKDPLDVDEEDIEEEEDDFF